MKTISLLTIFLLLFLFLRSRFPKLKEKTVFKSEKVLLVTLLLLTVIGFLSRIGQDELITCPTGESYYNLNNLILSSISASAFIFILFSKNALLKKVVVMFELLFWISLLFFQNVHVIALNTPIEVILLFNIGVTILRFLLLRFLFGWSQLRDGAIVLIAFFFIFINLSSF